MRKTTAIMLVLITITSMTLMETIKAQTSPSTSTISTSGLIVSSYIVSSNNQGSFSNIASALNTIPKTGGTLYVKEGTYTIDKTISVRGLSNLIITGENINTIFKIESGIILRFTDVSNLTIKNVTFEYTDNNYFTAMHFDGSNNGINIYNCTFSRNNASPNIQATDIIWFNSTGLTKNLLISGCYFKNAQIDAIAIKNVVGGTIENNTIVDAATCYNDYAAGITVDQSSNVMIRNNQFVRTGKQQMVAINVFNNSTDISIEGNTMINMQRAVSGYKATNIKVSQNQIMDSYEWSITFQYAINLRVTENNIQANNILNSTGLRFASCEDLTITSNNISKTTSGLIILDCDTVSVVNNKIHCLDASLNSNLWGILVHNSVNAIIMTNEVKNSNFYGIAVHLSPYTKIANNNISESKTSGIRLWKSDNSTIGYCRITDNGFGQSSYYSNNGIQIDGTSKCTINSNFAANVNSKYQAYGIFESTGSDYNMITDNHVTNNTAGTIVTNGTNSVVNNNN